MLTFGRETGTSPYLSSLIVVVVAAAVVVERLPLVQLNNISPSHRLHSNTGDF